LYLRIISDAARVIASGSKKDLQRTRAIKAIVLKLEVKIGSEAQRSK